MSMYLRGEGFVGGEGGVSSFSGVGITGILCLGGVYLECLKSQFMKIGTRILIKILNLKKFRHYIFPKYLRGGGFEGGVAGVSCSGSSKQLLMLLLTH